MDVRVDRAGEHELARGVDHLLAVGHLVAGADGGDRLPVHRDVRLADPVGGHHPAVPDDGVDCHSSGALRAG